MARINKPWLLVLTLGWGAALGTLLVWVKRNTVELVGRIVPDSVEERIVIDDVDNPYLIESMKKRRYDSSIRTMRKVRETSAFTSYIASYESDGLKQFALMNTPKGNMPIGGWPVVIVNHGHIDPEAYSTENSYINTSAYYAGQGFLVLKPDYRGHDNSEGEADGLLSRINYAVDVVNLIEGIKKLDKANSKQIYMYGHSMGGDVSLRVMEVCPKCVSAASLWAPAVYEWSESFLYFARRSTSGDPKRQERLQRRLRELETNFVTEEYPLVSTLDNVELVETPIVVQHATGDESVPYEWGMELVEKFKEKGKEVVFHSYQGDNHDISDNWGTALQRDVEFFRSQM